MAQRAHVLPRLALRTLAANRLGSQTIHIDLTLGILPHEFSSVPPGFQRLWKSTACFGQAPFPAA